MATDRLCIFHSIRPVPCKIHAPCRSRAIVWQPPDRRDCEPVHGFSLICQSSSLLHYYDEDAKLMFLTRQEKNCLSLREGSRCMMRCVFFRCLNEKRLGEFHRIKCAAWVSSFVPRQEGARRSRPVLAGFLF